MQEKTLCFFKSLQTIIKSRFALFFAFVFIIASCSEPDFGYIGNSANTCPHADITPTNISQPDYQLDFKVINGRNDKINELTIKSDVHNQHGVYIKTITKNLVFDSETYVQASDSHIFEILINYDDHYYFADNYEITYIRYQDATTWTK